MFDPVAYINEPRWRSMDLGLGRTQELLRHLGNPQDRLRFVHVAGTNGKGSVCASLASILHKANLRVGLFTSPYLVSFEERIRIDGVPISIDELRQVTLEVRDAAETMSEHPTEFELMTAVAFCYFAQKKCDLVVCEVGLGGRLDSTNVITTVELSIIVSIALDHCAFLGDTLAKIAREKAGIMKPAVPVVSAPQDPQAAAVLVKQASSQGCTLTFVDPAQICGTNDDFSYGTWNHLRLSLQGGYQLTNAAVVLEAVLALRALGWNVPDHAVEWGLSHVLWPGRFEIVCRQPEIIIDGAHNPQGARALASELSSRYTARRVVMCVGVMADKDWHAILASLVPLSSCIVCVEPDNPRALPAVELAHGVEQACLRAHHVLDYPVVAAPSVEDGVHATLTCANRDDVVVFCGSLYSIAQVKAALSREWGL